MKADFTIEKYNTIVEQNRPLIGKALNVEGAKRDA